MRKCLFQLKASLEPFVLQNSLASRRNQIFFSQVVITGRKIKVSGGSKQTSTIPIYFFETFSEDFDELLFIRPRTLRFYEFYIIANQPYSVTPSPHFNNLLQENAVQSNRHLNSTTYQLI